MGWYVEQGLAVGSRSNYASKNKSIMRGLAYHRRLYKLLTQHVAIHLPSQQLHIEPWFRELPSKRLLQPDAVLIDPASNTGLVVEVKMNWKDGRDEKLVKEYLPAAESAFELECTWPVLITSNVAGLRYPARLGLGALSGCAEWLPGDPTPVLLVP